MHRTLPLTVLMLTSIARAQQPPPEPAPDLSGSWQGEGTWHRITIQGEVGRAFDATGTQVATFRLGRTSRRGFSGFWQTVPLRGGTMALHVGTDGDTAHGWRRFDERTRKPARREHFTWHRTARSAGGAGGVTLEVYDDRARFEARIAVLRTVDFDDVDASGDTPVAIAADRYLERSGIVIRGRRGQFVHRDFGFADSYVPASPPNTYAPGPKADKDSQVPLGGHETTVTFMVKGRRAAVAAFGVVFVDPDHPGEAPSSLEAFDGETSLATEAVITGPNASRVFRGFVAVNVNGAPVPAITELRLVNGNVWPELDVGDGVTLDDFVFSPPIAR